MVLLLLLLLLLLVDHVQLVALIKMHMASSSSSCAVEIHYLCIDVAEWSMVGLLRVDQRVIHIVC